MVTYLTYRILMMVLFILAVGHMCTYRVVCQILSSRTSQLKTPDQIRGHVASHLKTADEATGQDNYELSQQTDQIDRKENQSNGSSDSINLQLTSGVPPVVCRISFDDVFGGSFVNCSYRNLTEIDPFWFPGNTTSLLLDGNNITILRNDSFVKLVNLSYLSIRKSHINAIQKTAFRGLINLKYLNLEGNTLSLEHRKFKVTTFMYTPNLTHLYIAFNTVVMFSDWEARPNSETKAPPLEDTTNSETRAPLEQSRYQDYIDIFQFLPHLTSLSIDTFRNLTLGHEFANFTQLTWLTLYCAPVREVYNNSFIGLAGLPLKTLVLTQFSNLLAPTIHPDLFQYVAGLEALVVSQWESGNHNILRSLWPFVGGNLTSLVLNDTKYSRYGESPDLTFNDGIIRRTSTKNISQLCLWKLVLSNSKLFAIENGAFSSDVWRRCLRVLDVSGNNFGFSAWRSLFFELHLLHNLDDITITSPPSTYEQVHPNYTCIMTADRNCHSSLASPTAAESVLSRGHLSTIPFYHQDDPLKPTKSEDLTKTLPHNLNKETTSVAKTPSFNTGIKLHPALSLQDGTDKSSVQFTSSSSANASSRYPIVPLIWLRMPPKVRFIRMAYITLQSFIQFRSTWKMLDAEQIEEIYALDIPFLFYCRGRLLGFENVKVLDVSGSMMDVEQHFYDDLPGLKVLVLNSILPLNYFQTVVSCKRLLRNLTSLTYLDLTNNGLNTLLPGTFTSNVQLTHLVLARNRFSSIPFEFHTTPRLRYLDMTDNAVPYLEEQEMSAIDAQIHQTGDFTLKLHGNAIVCLCSNIKFLAWLQTTHTNLDYGGNYTCTSQDGHITSTSDFSDTQGVWRQCVGSLSLMVTLIIASLMALTFLSVYLLMRFKTSLIAFVLNTIAPQFKAKTSRDYKTDVFIGYADDDYRYVTNVLIGFLEDDLRVTTFIHQRDLGVGFTDQLFYQAIHDSWRVLLVVTATFLQHYNMADIVMKYASHSVTPVNQGRVFVLMEESQVQHIPSYLLDVLDDTRIIIVHDLKSALTYEQQMSIKRCLGPIIH